MALANLELYAANWRWLHCLTFPIETLSKYQFSNRPYKWIRYAIGAVTGANGDLSLSHDSPDVINYDDGLPQDSVVLYYHTGDEEKRRIFPADLDIGRTNVTSSVATSRRARFRDDAHSKGDAVCYLSLLTSLSSWKWRRYILNYTQHRSRGPERNDILSEINSVRNGLFLNPFTHKLLGTDVAFLKVCDDCMMPNQGLITPMIRPPTLP